MEESDREQDAKENKKVLPEATKNRKYSWIWNGIANSSLKEDSFDGSFKPNLSLHMGDGKSISFWNDVCVGTVWLRNPVEFMEAWAAIGPPALCEVWL
ncbi:hypothetical protein V6N13_001570 [Hibiscus sabdariffa]